MMILENLILLVIEDREWKVTEQRSRPITRLNKNFKNGSKRNKFRRI
jgi:hypothetical protein